MKRLLESNFNFRYNFDVLSLAILNNVDYFYFSKSKYWYSEKFIISLNSMLDHVRWYETHIRKLSENVHRFDISEQVHGNGYRSFDIIFERFFSKCYRFCKDLAAIRDSRFFCPVLYLKQLQSHVSVLVGLKPGLTYLLKMLDENDTNHPLVISKHFTADELVKEYGLLDQTGFYGRCQGFYFCRSMRNTLWGVSVIMASFSDLYQKPGGPFSRAISAILNGVKYIMYPELRSQEIVNVAQNSSVEFLKSFWSLSETHFMKQLPKWICPNIEVLTHVWIPAEPISIKAEDGSKVVTIPVPSSHIPAAPVRCLLMSSIHRRGQIKEGKLDSFCVSPPSPSLLFHCHGGGFISQTPESHEIYLRHWAHELNVPIFSVDYSLAPGAPFPRALEEVLLAYVWALKNCEKIGWTGERICFVGDSAGGNILMGIIIKTISMRIRKPDAILCAYSPLILDLVPSPSRLLCWLDPLLPLGFMFSCLDSYIGDMQTDNNEYIEATAANRRRKLSSISDILDSSLSFLQENEWTEVNPNEPDTKDSKGAIAHELKEVVSSSETTSRDRTDHPTKEQSLPDHSTYTTDYISQFLSNYSKSDPLSHENIPSEDLLCDFPQDFVYNVKQKCTSLLYTAVGSAMNRVEQNKWYKTLLSPFVPTDFFKSKIRSSPCVESQLSVADKIKRLKVVTSNPYISPLLVSNDVLKEMPQIYFISLNFDPCLDDSITFAKRMESVGRPVVLDVLDGLPHGFLNFLPFSREAHDGSDLCVKRIREALWLHAGPC